MTKETISTATVEAIARILEYIEYDENEDFEECSEDHRKTHIYRSIRQLRSWFDNDIPLEARKGAEDAIAADRKVWDEAIKQALKHAR